MAGLPRDLVARGVGDAVAPGELGPGGDVGVGEEGDARLALVLGEDFGGVEVGAAGVVGKILISAMSSSAVGQAADCKQQRTTL